MRAAIAPRRRGGEPSLALAVAAAIPITLAIQGTARMHAIDALRASAPSATIGLVDAVIPATTRWEAAEAPGILATLSRLTLGAEQRGAEVTVWPESGYPYVLARGSRAGPSGSERLLQYGVRGPLLAGVVTRDSKGDRYNAAIAVRPDGALTSEYDKMHLLWFGEEVPFATELPWIRRTFARGLGMLPGEHPVLSTLGRVKAGALICFEDTLPGAAREAASLAPNLLVNMTNDAWFAGSPEPAMHLSLAAMRAIEARRDLVRAVNLGPASLIDAAGPHPKAQLRRRGSGLARGQSRAPRYAADALHALRRRAGDRRADRPRARLHPPGGEPPATKRGHKTQRAPNHRVIRRSLRLEEPRLTESGPSAT